MGRVDWESPSSAPLVVKSLSGTCLSSIPNRGNTWGPRGEREQGTTAQCADTPPSVMQPMLPPGIQLTDTLEQMQQGTLMRKVKSKSWKKQRYFKLQDDCMTIWYQSKRTGKTESACEYQLLCVGHVVISRAQSEQGCECMEILGAMLAKGAAAFKRGSVCVGGLLS